VLCPPATHHTITFCTLHIAHCTLHIAQCIVVCFLFFLTIRYIQLLVSFAVLRPFARLAPRRLLCSAPQHGLSFDLDSDTRAMQDLARSFARDEIIPVAADYDRTGEFPWPVIKKAHAAGLMNHMVPESCGGPGLGVLPGVVMSEQLAYGCTGVSVRGRWDWGHVGLMRGHGALCLGCCFVCLFVCFWAFGPWPCRVRRGKQKEKPRKKKKPPAQNLCSWLHAHCSQGKLTLFQKMH
jgi:hypothetical protein